LIISMNILARRSRSSGEEETACPELGNRSNYSLNDLSNPYTSRMDVSFDGSMLSIRKEIKTISMEIK
jgi:hypothetical protein